MNKRLLLIILTIALIAGGIFAWVFLTQNKYAPQTTGFENLTGFLPLGENLPVGETPAPIVIGGSTTTVDVIATVPRLRKLTPTPVSGATIYSREIDVIRERVKEKEKQYFVRYMDRGNGHIYDTRAEIEATVKVANMTIPRVYEAFFRNPDSLVARYLSDTQNESIVSYLMTLTDPVATTTATSTVASLSDEPKLKEVSGVYLDDNIRDISIAPSGRLLYLLYAETGGTLSLTERDGSRPRIVLSHPLREWLFTAVSDTKAVIATKPSGYVRGFGYTLNIGTGSLSKIIGNIPGLTFLPNAAGTSYLGGAAANILQLFIISDATKEGRNLPFATLPEKCVWMKTEATNVICSVPVSLPSGVYPDDWYKGVASFTDNIWKLDTTTGQTTLVAELTTETEEPIDAIKLTLSDDDKYLVFTNKKDLSLWLYDLKPGVATSTVISEE